MARKKTVGLGCAIALAVPLMMAPWAARSVAAPPGFPDPADVGFHHAALVYADQAGTTAALLPLVNRVDTSGAMVPGDSLYDAFLFLTFTVDGVAMDYGASTMPQWTDALDLWFAAGGPLANLDAAVGQANAAATAAGAPNALPRHHVILMMPWLNPEVASFGVVDGADRNLSVAADRQAVAAWYTALAAQRFADAGFANLDLWGMYRMREDITPFEQHLMAADAAGIHASGLKYLFIPYYLAPGWNLWRDYGFDAAIMQPSYAFRAIPDSGRVDASRLDAAAALAAQNGLGIEIETRGCASMPIEQVMAAQYLAVGTATGYQAGVSAAFLGAGLATCGAVTSSDPAQRRVYDLVADYVSGKSVASPDTVLSTRLVTSDPTGTGPAGATATYRFSVDDLRALPGLRVDLVETAGVWRGTVTVRAWQSGATWTQLAWAARGTGDSLAGPIQGLAMPLPAADVPGGPATVDVEFVTSAGSAVTWPNVTKIVIDRATGEVTASALQDGVTVVSGWAAAPPGNYPDPGGLLTDGVASTTGWRSGQNAGWNSSPGQVAIQVDLGSAKPVGSVRLDTQGGSDAAVNWPLNPVVLFSDMPVVEPAGLGSSPVTDAWAFGAPVITGRHAPGLPSGLPTVAGVTCQSGTEVTCTNLDGYIVATGEPRTTRYLTVFFSTDAWAMASELSVLDPAGNRLDMTYRLVRPTGSYDNYADNGQRLTDGYYISDFAWRQFSGWPANYDVTLDITLPEPRTIDSLSLWSADIAAYGIEAPTFTAAIETTPGNWVYLDDSTTTLTVEPFGTFGKRIARTGVSVDGATSVRIWIPQTADWWAWHMLSEVTATPAPLPTIPAATVTFDGNMGTPASSAYLTFQGGHAAVPSAPTRPGYTFTGWNTAADGSGTPFTTNSAVTGDTLVYAVWRPAANPTTPTASVSPSTVVTSPTAPPGVATGGTSSGLPGLAFVALGAVVFGAALLPRLAPITGRRQR